MQGRKKFHGQGLRKPEGSRNEKQPGSSVASEEGSSGTLRDGENAPYALIGGSLHQFVCGRNRVSRSGAVQFNAALDHAVDRAVLRGRVFLAVLRKQVASFEPFFLAFERSFLSHKASWAVERPAKAIGYIRQEGRLPPVQRGRQKKAAGNVPTAL